jgi:site-specific recombinase XerD
VRAIFNFAAKRGMRPDNPAKGVEHYEERGRRRYLTDEEAKKLFQVLDAQPNQKAADVVKLLLRTGAREGGNPPGEMGGL